MEKTLVMILGLLLASTFVVGTADQEDLLPSHNLWECAFELISNPNFASKLHVSKLQVDQLKALRKDGGPFANAFKARYPMYVRVPFGSMQDPTGTISKTWHSLDKEVHGELAKILHPAQLKVLRGASIRFGNPNSISPFNSNEVQSGLALTKEQLREFLTELKKIELDFQSKHIQLKRDSVTKIVDFLEPDARQRFVDYAGAELLEGISPNEVDFEKLPYPKSFFQADAESLLHSKKLVEKMALSPDQATALKKLDDDLQQQLNAVMSNPEEYKSQVGATLSILRRRASEQTWEILNPEQQLSLLRHHASIEFLFDFRETFRRDDFIQYLGLKPKDVAFFRSVTEEEWDDVQQKLVELDHATFQSICSKLPDEKRKKLEASFGDAFLIRLPIPPLDPK